MIKLFYTIYYNTQRQLVLKFEHVKAKSPSKQVPGLPFLLVERLPYKMPR